MKPVTESSLKPPIRFKENIPIYVQIADDIKGQIIAGILPEGDKLPSIREYSVKYAVTALTMQRALTLLETDNIVETKKGVGSFVMAGIQSNLKYSVVKGQVLEFITQLSRMGLSDDEIIVLVKEGLKNGEH